VKSVPPGVCEVCGRFVRSDLCHAAPGPTGSATEMLHPVQKCTSQSITDAPIGKKKDRLPSTHSRIHQHTTCRGLPNRGTIEVRSQTRMKGYAKRGRLFPSVHRRPADAPAGVRISSSFLRHSRSITGIMILASCFSTHHGQHQRSNTMCLVVLKHPAVRR